MGDAPEQEESRSAPEPSTEAAAPRPATGLERMVVPRWVQLVVLPLMLLGVWALARAAGPVLLVFVVAGVIALILNPLVKQIERTHLPRGLAVAGVYLGFVVILAGVAALLVNPIADQVTELQRDIPGIVDSANRSLDDVQAWLDEENIDIAVKEPGGSVLTTLQRNVLQGSGSVLEFTRDLLTTIVEGAFGLILIIVISIYMLLYAERIGALVRSIMPPGGATPEDDFPLRAQKAVFGYVRGQLAFSAIMGVSAGIALWIFGALGIFPPGQDYAWAFGAWFGLMEAVPYVGPVLGAIPPILVALFTEPLDAVWLVLLFVALQQLEGHVVAPTVFGHSLRINPLLVIFALLIGAQLYGIIGALVALPIAAVARETVIYLRRHLVLEPWGTPSPAAIIAARARGPGAVEAPTLSKPPELPGDGDANGSGADDADAADVESRPPATRS